MSNAPYTLMLLVLGSVQTAGCIGIRSGRGSIAFSPDGTHISYLREDRLEELVVDGKIWSRNISLLWCSVSDPATESSAAIETLGAEFRSYIHVPCLEAKWSPESSRIGVLTPHKLIIVEANSRKKTEIRDGTITSFAWLSDEHCAYLTRRLGRNTQRLVICRVDLDTQQKTDVFAFPERPRNLSIGSGDWSPSGKFLILMEPDGGRQYHCVNVFDGTVRSLGQTDAYNVGVAWAPDSSRAFCVSGKVGPGDRYEALMLDPETGVTVDCTAGFHQTFAGHAPSLAPLWTVDGKYVLINALDIGGHLVQPDPWEAVPLGQKLAPRFTVPKLSKTKPWLFRLPVPDWVGVLPTGNVGDSPVKYAADYSGEQVRTLLENCDYWAISPDATVAATIGQDNRVRILKLDKWDKGHH